MPIDVQDKQNHTSTSPRRSMQLIVAIPVRLRWRPAKVMYLLVLLIFGAWSLLGQSALLLPDISIASLYQSDPKRKAVAGTTTTTTTTSQQPSLLSLPLCSREQIRNGQWLPAQLDKALYDPSLPRLKTCVTRGVMADPADKTRPWNTWIWQPKDATLSSLLPLANNNNSFPEDATAGIVPTCQFTEWSKDEFCRLARGHSIAFAGDSLTFAAY
jgi:hypothetical protein